MLPSVTGWFGRANPFAFDAKSLDWAAGAGRFDSGTPPIVNAYIARAGMEAISAIGIEKIRAWHQVLAARLRDGGRERGLTLHGTSDLSRKTANSAFVVSDSHAMERAMRARGVLPSARGPVIRLAPHYYNTIDDVDAALDLLAELTRSERP
jgi:selenocysteine lyase/cysteine desulfurase